MKGQEGVFSENYRELMVFVGFLLVAYSIFSFSSQQADISVWSIERVLGIVLICSGIFFETVYGKPGMKKREGFVLVGIFIIAPVLVSVLFGPTDVFARWSMSSLLLSPLGAAGMYHIYRSKKAQRT